MSLKTDRRGERIDGLVILDKPLGLSSNAALQRVRRVFQAAKAGHTGSLDPLATGLLPICLGEATKLSGLLLDAPKRYRVRAAVGAATTTGDAEGPVTARSDPASLTREALLAALDRFRGPQHQRPPMYSALKRGGRPLYEIARAGGEVERPLREVEIATLELAGFGDGGFELDVRCSKGTYIRTLVEDIAAAAGQHAHVAALRRLEAGPFRESDMVSLDVLELAAREGRDVPRRWLRPALDAIPDWRRLAVGEGDALRLGQGGRVPVAVRTLEPGPVAVTDLQGRLLGLGRVDADRQLAPQRWLVPPGP